MHIPSSYKKTDVTDIKDFLIQNSFGFLINQVNGKPWATHIPLELDVDKDSNDVLVGHISKVNPQADNFIESNEVLCIFNGPHSYISSSWYEKEDAPTWNYIAVHIYGKLHMLSEDEIMESFHKLVNKYEKNSKNPISTADMSEKTLKQIKGVVGFKILIEDI